jgi:hypothetical protein
MTLARIAGVGGDLDAGLQARTLNPVLMSVFLRGARTRYEQYAKASRETSPGHGGGHPRHNSWELKARFRSNVSIGLSSRHRIDRQDSM